ncbi:F-actin-monooxygenase MICAL1 isoform X1 [Chrysemys picta bellii]|uniref:F-actin-monooxygenase MICAL1 isoform X1 n=1 Tax=Chrysemys picta bellii TaxID=8478 RepID=UPI000388C20B|nr:F-actin-monooxygenase MICAL1 isoform X1 [Chrysemys picta bellii]
MNPQDGEQGNPAHSLFETFLRANHCEEVLGSFQALCRQLALEHKGQLQFYHKLKSCLNYWSAKALWGKLDKKAGHKDYDQGKACANTKCLIIGAGPCGLRTAIELAFLGARVVLVEKRDSFSRNNVLHLWPFTIHDLRALGAKKFYGRFCTGALDHISIRQLQLILLKVALLLGVEIHINVQFKGLIPPAAKGSGRGGGWKAALQPSSSPVGQYEFDVLISAGGGKFVPEGFKRKETRGKLAIGITTNFVNHHSRAEVEVAEISGVARIYNQQFFQNLYNKTGIDLENIVYYKDDTHYFVMTAKKQSLLQKGVIVQDKADIESLLSAENVNQEALLSYAKEAANFSTNYQLPDLEFALNHRNHPDVDMFDFTCMNRSENAALVRECHGARLLIGLVGDCLVEPFWPLGTGVARGFLAAFDAAWMVKRWAAGTAPLDLLAERESIYQQLSQTSPDNTNKNTSQYSIDPTTRYRNINLQAIKPNQVRDLYVVGKIEINHKKRDSRNSRDVSSAYEGLLSWCQTHTEGYRGVTVTDFTHSWKSGLALCALIHRFRPSLLDFNSLDQHSPLKNNQLALDIAEQELGIPPVLSSTEMAAGAEPNQLGLITYLSQFYEAFKSSAEPEERARKLLAPPGTRGAVLFLSKLQKTLSLTRKRNQDSAQKDAETKRTRREAGLESGVEGDLFIADLGWGTNHQEQPQPTEINPSDSTLGRRQSSLTSPAESSDACYFCGKRVYILERVSAEGHFFHRGCFQCHQCGTTLRLGDFVFDEDDGHFYCMLHYSSPHSVEVTDSACHAAPQEDPSQGARFCSPFDAGSLGLATGAAKLRVDSDGQDPPGSPSSFPKQLAVAQPSEPWEGAGGAGEGAVPAREDRGSGTADMQQPAAQPRTVLEENVGRPISSLVAGRAQPQEPGAGLGDRANGWPQREEQSLHERGRSGTALRQPSPEPRPPEKGPAAPDFRQAEEEGEDSRKRKKIQLSPLEKLKLSMLSLDSDPESQGGPGKHRAGSEPFQSAAPVKDQGTLERGQVCWVEPGFSEEAEDIEETDSDDEEEEKEEESQDLGYLTENRLLSLGEKEKYPTWKRTLTRRAKEEEMKRFCKAQSIQRRLEEIEVTFRKLEEKGIQLERSLRGEGGTQSELKTQWMNKLLSLVQKKNSLVSEESDLMIEAQELKLEEKQCLLDQELRRYMNMEETLKMPQDRLAEKEILAQLLEVVNQRNALIHVLEEKRLSELSEALPGTAQGWAG